MDMTCKALFDKFVLIFYGRFLDRLTLIHFHRTAAKRVQYGLQQVSGLNAQCAGQHTCHSTDDLDNQIPSRFLDSHNFHTSFRCD